MKYSWKGLKDRNRQKNRIKRSGQAWLVYAKTQTVTSPPREGEPMETGKWSYANREGRYYKHRISGSRRSRQRYILTHTSSYKERPLGFSQEGTLSFASWKATLAHEASPRLAQADQETNRERQRKLRRLGNHLQRIMFCRFMSCTKKKDILALKKIEREAKIM